MTLDNLDYEIEIAIEAAKTSGKLLLENRKELNNEISVTTKDIKLRADVSSENLIKEIIFTNSNYPILAEESGKSKKNLGKTFWVIDPLDGTANYNRDIPICCVSIGLVHNMEPIVGVIYDFNNNDLFVGNCPKNTSTLNDMVIKVSNIQQKKESILITGLPHGANYSDEALNTMIDDMQSWKKVRMIGSAAMASCYVASGKAELYKENGIFLWDVAAGAAIVSASGGQAIISNLQENYQVDVIFSNSKIQ